MSRTVCEARAGAAAGAKSIATSQGRHVSVYSLVTQIAAYDDTPQPITIHIDKSLYGIRREDFDEYLIKKMMNNPHNRIIDKDLISIRHVASESEPCIQAADFVAGALNKRYRADDGDHYHIIAHKMILEIDAFDDHKKKK
ncbi:MAG: DUF3800 domain-containing protein [Methanomicrobiaceae archaeon]|nr:DUF3800 domain-containing protein [Methanomicrobiaceae archaeon]